MEERKIYLLALFNTICLLIAAIDVKNIILWIIFMIVLMLNIWIVIDQKRKNRSK